MSHTLAPITIRHRTEKSGSSGWEAVTIGEGGIVTKHTTFLRESVESVIALVERMISAGMIADREIEVAR